MNRTLPPMDMRLHAPAPTRPDTRPLFQALRKGRLLPLVVCLLLSFGTTAAGQSFYQGSGTHPSPPPVPQYIVFAGDTIRFDRSDLYERMDRELIAFTYSHTNSLLMLKRSERIFHQVVPLLNLHGIPEDLKYLMAIESNLSPKALSTAGAAGLWQFMKGTAKEYGLVVTAEVDERYNIEKETVAACKFLRKAYSRYHDWMTVAASYNGGQGGISAKLSSLSAGITYYYQACSVSLWPRCFSRIRHCSVSTSSLPTTTLTTSPGRSSTSQEPWGTWQNSPRSMASLTCS